MGGSPVAKRDRFQAAALHDLRLALTWVIVGALIWA
jgi:hypothetical protein